MPFGNMAYHGRIAIVGNYKGKPFAGTVLQSESDPERVIKPWEKGNGANYKSFANTA